MITNCKNCGAPLQKNKCDYCGTNYELTPKPLIKKNTNFNVSLVTVMLFLAPIAILYYKKIHQKNNT